MSTNGHAVLGIDVGLDGALAFYRDGCWMVCDMPTVGDGKRHRREINCAAICARCCARRRRSSTPISSTPPAMPRKASPVCSAWAARSARMALVAANIPHKGRHIASVGRKAVARGRHVQWRP
jgi:hypothetical protein